LVIFTGLTKSVKKRRRRRRRRRNLIWLVFLYRVVVISQYFLHRTSWATGFSLQLLTFLCKIAVTNWSGKHSHMDEEVERDCRKNRKRNYENAYNEEFDRGRVSHWVGFFDFHMELPMF
jgi:hypothetical protein